MAFNPEAFSWFSFKIRKNQDKDAPISLWSRPPENLQGIGTSTTSFTFFADGAVFDVPNDKYVRVVQTPTTKSQGLSS